MGSIQREMKQRDSLLWSRIALKLVGGIPLALAGPLIFAIVMSLLGWAYDWSFSHFLLWLALGLVLFGILAWQMTRRDTGDVFAAEMMQLVGEQPEFSREDLSLKDIVGQEPKAALDIMLGSLSHGCDRVYEAWRLMQARKRFTAEKQQRAAELLRDLSTYPAAVPWTDLRAANESLHDLLGIMGYLKLTDWIDVSKDGRKVWLQSDARKAASFGGDR